MKNQKQKFINCPHCGAQYIPSEIFIPKYMLERKEVEKDCYGKIIFCEGEEPETKEKYQCDFCNNVFHVNVSIDFSVDSLDDFDEETTVKFDKKLTMSEK